MPFLYGKADEKYVKVDSGTKKQKLKPLDTYKFHLNPAQEETPKIKQCDVSIRLRISPDKLVEICTPVVNANPLPYPFQWNVLQVAEWIRKLGFPEYQNTFKKNLINGRTLIRLDASYLVKMNIKDFDHLRIITHAIRELYEFEKSSFNRSLSLPDRALENQYKFFHTKTGPKYDVIRRTDLGRMRNLLRPRSLYETHWQSLERWLTHSGPFESELIGGVTRKKNTLFHPRKGKSLAVDKKKNINDCSGMPPCMCYWTKDKDFRQPWKLKCLRNKIQHKIHTDDCVCKCKCSEMCLCGSQKDLTFLKEHIPHKYTTTDSKKTHRDRPGRIRSSEI